MRKIYFSSLLVLSLFIFTSCSGIMGYGVMLWNLPESGLRDGDIVPVYIKSNISHSDLLNKDLNYNWICHPAVCFKKKIFDVVYANENMFYNPEYDGSEDYELWLRLIDKYDCNITSDIHKVLKYNIAKIKLPSLDQKILSKYYDELLYGKTFGIYYIATGIYKNDFPRFINSLKNFFPNNYKKVILIFNEHSDILKIVKGIDKKWKKRH